MIAPKTTPAIMRPQLSISTADDDVFEKDEI
jgi:hypothetical protein